MQALKQIDGVTRVGVQSSALGESGGGSGSTCQTRDFIAQFQMVAAFDAAPAPSEEGAAGEAAPAPAPEPSGETTTASSEPESEGN